jgi:hypothetical protein
MSQIQRKQIKTVHPSLAMRFRIPATTTARTYPSTLKATIGKDSGPYFRIDPFILEEALSETPFADRDSANSCRSSPVTSISPTHPERFLEDKRNLLTKL